MVEPKNCPLCNKKLSLKQVNFNVAVYICEDLTCSYPIGFDCTIVEREFKDMDKQVESLDNRDEDLNDWLGDIMEKSTEPDSREPLTDKTVPNDPIAWIDNLIEGFENGAEAPAPNETTDDNETESSMALDLDELFNFVHNIN